MSRSLRALPAIVMAFLLTFMTFMPSAIPADTPVVGDQLTTVDAAWQGPGECITMKMYDMAGNLVAQSTRNATLFSPNLPGSPCRSHRQPEVQALPGSRERTEPVQPVCRRLRH